MEELLEFVVEFVLEGVMAIAGERKAPIWLRIFVMVFFSAFYIAFTALLVYIGFQSNEPWVKVLMNAIAAGILAVLIYLWRKNFKKIKERKREEQNEEGSVIDIAQRSIQKETGTKTQNTEIE